MYRVILFSRLKVPVIEFILGRDSGEVGSSLCFCLSHLIFKSNTWPFSSYPFPGASGNLSVTLPFSLVISPRLHLSPLLLLLCPVGFSLLLLFWPGIQLLSFTWFYPGGCFQPTQAEKDWKKTAGMALGIYHLQENQTFPSTKMAICWQNFVLKNLCLIFLSKLVLQKTLFYYPRLLYARPQKEKEGYALPQEEDERGGNMLSWLIWWTDWILPSS